MSSETDIKYHPVVNLKCQNQKREDFNRYSWWKFHLSLLIAQKTPHHSTCVWDGRKIHRLISIKIFGGLISNHLPDTKCVLFRESINYRMENTKITTHSNDPADQKAGTSFNWHKRIKLVISGDVFCDKLRL